MRAAVLMPELAAAHAHHHESDEKHERGNE